MEQAYIIQKLEEATGQRCPEYVGEKLVRYYHMLAQANEIMNLTRIISFEDVVEKHFADALTVERVVNIISGMKIADLGSGAGVPGIPIAVLHPEVDIISIDSVNKKLAFQNEVATALGLEHFSTVHGRLEDLAHDPTYREQFDLVTARALAPLPVLIEYSIPFLKVGGQLIAYKSLSAQHEMKESAHALGELGAVIDDIFSYQIQGEERIFIIISKEKETPAQFPRKAGTPSKRPL